MAIVMISYEMGTAGPEIGLLLASRLRYRYVSRRLIIEAACQLRRAAAWVPPGGPPGLPTERLGADTRQHLAATRAALYGFAQEDDVVMMNHGCASIMRDVPHALQVAIVAPLRVRVRRLIETLARDPYDVTINCERLSTLAAMGLLSELVRQPGLATTPAGLALVGDGVLASKVQLALAVNPTTRQYRIGVQARQGIVLLQSPEVLDAAVEVAREVPGVQRVIMRSLPWSLGAAGSSA